MTDRLMIPADEQHRPDAQGGLGAPASCRHQLPPVPPHPSGQTEALACEMPLHNATQAEVAGILQSAKTIAVVGLSDKPDRASYRVAAYMQAQGYRIIPVNPQVTQVLGERAYARLRDLPGAVDMVNIFRKPEVVPDIVAEAIALGATIIWMQEGIAHNAAADQARAAGLKVVMNRCLLKEHRAWFATPRSP